MISVDLQKCFGCSACASVCSAGAIQMKPDGAGFLYPQIDNEKCSDCGLCQSVCPIDVQYSETVNTFRGLKAKGQKRMESTSGGTFRLLADRVISNGGVVFGCDFDEDFHLIYKTAENEEETKKLLGTKYVQSDPADSFEMVSKYLKSGRNVLFFGNPCTVHGLRLYIERIFGNVPDNLLLVDHICYGVPSPKFWEQYAKYLGNIHGGKLVSFNFRAKTEPDSAHTICYDVEKDGERFQYTKKYMTDPYVRIFNKNISLRNSCLSCPYCKEDRVSDITLGDFWGIENTAPDFDDGYGVSLVISHSDKGEKHIKEILSETENFVTDAEASSQPRLHECGKAPILRKLFMNDMARASVTGINTEMLIKKYGG